MALQQALMKMDTGTTIFEKPFSERTKPIFDITDEILQISCSYINIQDSMSIKWASRKQEQLGLVATQKTGTRNKELG